MFVATLYVSDSDVNGQHVQLRIFGREQLDQHVICKHKSNGHFMKARNITLL
jgi:hypothetical protein